MNRNKVTVIESTNVDKFLNVKGFPKPGETLHTNQAQREFGGGKGANQAIAASRSAADTTFISKIDKDGNANFMLEDLKKAGIHTQYTLTSENEETGQAFITVDGTEQNIALVYGGANMTLGATDVEMNAEAFIGTDFVVAQLEAPFEAIEQAFKIARRQNITTILNPAPAIELPKSLLELADIIIPNETEVELLISISINSESDMEEIAVYFLNLGIFAVLITLGEQGTYCAYQEQYKVIPTCNAKAVDTTAAGDTFIDVFLSESSKGLSNLESAIRLANQASSLTVRRKGAQASIPARKEVEAEYN